MVALRWCFNVNRLYASDIKSALSVNSALSYPRPRLSVLLSTSLALVRTWWIAATAFVVIGRKLFVKAQGRTNRDFFERGRMCIGCQQLRLSQTSASGVHHRRSCYKRSPNTEAIETADESDQTTIGYIHWPCHNAKFISKMVSSSGDFSSTVACGWSRILCLDTRISFSLPTMVHASSISSVHHYD